MSRAGAMHGQRNMRVVGDGRLKGLCDVGGMGLAGILVLVDYGPVHRMI